MSTAALLVVAVLGCSLADPTVRIRQGVVKGFMLNGTASFLGIPFAEPPVGKLRFAPPVPVSPWSGTLSTTAFGPQCMQDTSAQTSEDCLTLNVFAPESAHDLPVMVFIHGGSFVNGGSPLYPCWHDSSIVRDKVFVTINYRLGAFGFLASDALRPLDPSASTGNAGLLDQRLALAWVRENIAAFGGNSALVTIYGESAGAASVGIHFVTPPSHALFDHAIMESGALSPWSAKTLPQAAQVFAQVVAASACNSSADVVACLQALPPPQLLAAQRAATRGTAQLVWGPVVDGVVLKDLPIRLAAAGHSKPGAAAIVGTNLNEGTEFISAFPRNASAAEFRAALANLVGQTVAPAVEALYPLPSYPSPWAAMADVVGDLSFVCPSRTAARLFAAAGDVYLYHFTQPIKAFEPRGEGVFHGEELYFLFLDLEHLTADEVALGADLLRTWATFAATGAPGAVRGVEWPAYEEAADEDLNLNFAPVVEARLKVAQCDFWQRVQTVGGVHLHTLIL